MEPTPLTMVINLRAQAEKASRTQNMFDKRVGGWYASSHSRASSLPSALLLDPNDNLCVVCRATWEQIQQARVKAIGLLNEAPAGNTSARLVLLRDTTACSLLSLLPPDRVGLVRKLRLGHTLKRRDDGGWRLDLTKARDGHKTSKHTTASPT